MATQMFLLKVAACLAMLCMVLGTYYPLANAAPTCGQMQLMVAPCIGYLRSPASAVPGPCCSSLKNLYSQCRIVPDRQNACRCLKSTALSIPGLNLKALSALPNNCGINLSYKVTPSIDCNKVN